MKDFMLNHIQVLFTELDDDNDFIKAFINTASNFNKLQYNYIKNNISKDNEMFFSLSVLSSTIVIKIKGHFNYYRLIDSISIELDLDSIKETVQRIESSYDIDFVSVFKHLIIKCIFKEFNSILIRAMYKSKVLVLEVDKCNVIKTSVDKPPVLIYGEQIYFKEIPYSKKEVGKEWAIYRTNKILTHEEVYSDCLLAVKTVHVSNKFSQVDSIITSDEAEAIEWIIKPTAKKSPDELSLLFDIRVYATEHCIKDVAGEIEIAIEQERNKIVEYKTPSVNEVTKAISDDLKNNETVGLFSPDVTASATDKLVKGFGELGANLFIHDSPESFLDNDCIDKPINFEVGEVLDEPEEVLRNRFGFEGWLVSYINTREDKPYVPIKNDKLRRLVKWFQLLVYKTIDNNYVVAKIYRSKRMSDKDVMYYTIHNTVDEVIENYGTATNDGGGEWIGSILRHDLL